MPDAPTYPPPAFWKEQKVKKKYGDWLDKKATKLRKKDQEKWPDREDVKRSTYKKAIHTAVTDSKGNDQYTGELLEWWRVWDANRAKSEGSRFRREFARYPVVDHLDPREPGKSGKLELRICGLRTNGCKDDLPLSELEDFCKKFLKAQNYKVSPPA